MKKSRQRPGQLTDGRSRCPLISVMPSITGHSVIPAFGFPLNRDRIDYEHWTACGIQAEGEARDVAHDSTPGWSHPTRKGSQKIWRRMENGTWGTPSGTFCE